MKKTTRIVLIVAILITSLACNLSQYMSDTPPVDWVAPTNEPGTKQEGIDFSESCIPTEVLSESYTRFTGEENIVENPYDYLNEVIGNVFQEAILTQSDTFFSKENEKIISCAVFSPLNSFEKISFDFMLKQPENIIPFIEMPDIEIGKSDLSDQFQTIGDSFGIYHLELFSESNYSAEFLDTRKDDSVFIYTYVYRNSNDDLSDFSNLIVAIQ
jgi:hypothetical protein